LGGGWVEPQHLQQLLGDGLPQAPKNKNKMISSQDLKVSDMINFARNSSKKKKQNNYNY